MTLRRTALPLLLLVLAVVPSGFGQTESATLSGLITDPQGKVVPDVVVEVTNVDTNVSVHQTTNGAGLYLVVGLKPGRYRVSVTREGFRRIDLTGLVLNVQDVLSRNFQLQLGPVMASITVVADEAKVNTESATVSTVVDRQFAENLPMSGRSFQSLIQLTPGVVLTQTSTGDQGQFSVNGQRADSNSWVVDGAAANIGMGAFSPANGISGSIGSFSTMGGTNGLVSVDAMQEFRIQTSTYAPEFGSTPGAQISIVTRSGTNQFHGTVFDYLRNDALDANNWFNGYTNNPPLPKAKERQNDFGGVLGGPIIKDRTFFFFSYEGLRLRLPQTSVTTVPNLNSRHSAPASLQPYLNAFPFDPKQPDLGNGIAQFNASYSVPATLDAYSIRIDHKQGKSLNLFGRYNHSPSSVVPRGSGGQALSNVYPARVTTQTATIGATWVASTAMVNDLRLNYSRVSGASSFSLDDFGGATPLDSFPLPNPFSTKSAFFDLGIFSLVGGGYQVGLNTNNLQRQINVVDSLALQKGAHAFKFGGDFRRLSPVYDPAQYFQAVFFNDIPSFQAGAASFSVTNSFKRASVLFRNVGLFAQDTWRITPRLTLTYGLRWDVDFTPSSDPALPAATGFNLNDLSKLALAPTGTSPFKTTYGIAPRVGGAYQLGQHRQWETVARGGFGVFYGQVGSEVGNILWLGAYPFGASAFNLGPTFPLDSATAAPPKILPPDATQGILTAFDPNFKLPYTLEWNAALEQSLGGKDTISATYIGAAGRRLIQSASIQSPNPNLLQANLIANTAVSGYNALQIQFRRPLSHGLQALTSYTWSHSIDTASAGSLYNTGNDLVLPLNSNANRGPSDFDIRHAFSAGITYDLPSPEINAFTNAILRGWSLQTGIQARSASPVNIFFSQYTNVSGSTTDVRPDVVPGIPFYLYGSQFPGGKAFNPAAFQSPPLDPTTQLPLRDGNLGRNALRGFGATQWDFAVHRDFPIHESVKLQFRAEMFNFLNHPNFGPPNPTVDQAGFGIATQMLGQSLQGGTQGEGGFNPLYQLGGPRSVQVALKLAF